MQMITIESDDSILQCYGSRFARPDQLIVTNIFLSSTDTLEYRWTDGRCGMRKLKEQMSGAADSRLDAVLFGVDLHFDTHRLATPIVENKRHFCDAEAISWADAHINMLRHVVEIVIA